VAKGLHDTGVDGVIVDEAGLAEVDALVIRRAHAGAGRPAAAGRGVHSRLP
jgi:hypothetical protein